MNSDFPNHISYFKHENIPEEYLKNSLGINKKIKGVVKPKNKEEIKDIIGYANETNTGIWPISRGKNIGYGDMLPLKENNVILDLSEMNSIKSFDNELGRIRLEPGVSQEELYEFLTSIENNNWIMDATGAGKDSSIIGNSLEGGFGHTPMGNRRKNITGIEAIMGNGKVLKPTTYPNIGPDINGIFVQGPYGVVTEAEFQLYNMPADFNSFRITTSKEENLETLLDNIRDLRQKEIMDSLVHIADPMRMLVTTSKIPEEYKDKIMNYEEASRAVSSESERKVYWTALGGIYGDKGLIRAKKRRIKEKFKGSNANIMFFNDKKIELYKNLGKSMNFTKLGSIAEKAMTGYKNLHGLMKGVPSDIAEDNIGWRTEPYNTGTLWISPTFDSKGENARKMYEITKEHSKRHGFEIPVTITLVEPFRCVGILNLNYDKLKDKEKAFETYESLLKKFYENDIFTYRTSIIGMGKNMHVPNPGNWKIYRDINNALDPNNIIAPGRYQI
ncbi:MAG: FAD-binding oxidoreductase [Nanobdellota archaeon]